MGFLLGGVTLEKAIVFSPAMLYSAAAIKRLIIQIQLQIHLKYYPLVHGRPDRTHKTTGVVVSDCLGVTKSFQQRV